MDNDFLIVLEEVKNSINRGLHELEKKIDSLTDTITKQSEKQTDTEKELMLIKNDCEHCKLDNKAMFETLTNEILEVKNKPQTLVKNWMVWMGFISMIITLSTLIYGFAKGIFK